MADLPTGETDSYPQQLFLNRELSALEFNFRVLAQARDAEVPLLERVRYLCISNTNLDEFFEVRVAVLKQQGSLVEMRLGADGVPPVELLARIRQRTLELVEEQYAVWNSELKPALAETGIMFRDPEQWTPAQREWLQRYFEEETLPVLSPLRLDPAHPFPRILNKSLNLAVILEGRDAFGREGRVALVRAPRSLPRIIRLPPEVCENPYEFVFLSNVLHCFADAMFPGFEVRGSYQFRVTRNSELAIEEEEIENLAHALSEELPGRGYARPVRLEVAADCPGGVTGMLMTNFGLEQGDVYRCNGPVNINRVDSVYDQIDRPDLKFEPFTPRIAPELDNEAVLFQAIDQHDILLHHPYDSFAPVLDLVRQATHDPDVLAIKQTLYRVGEDSPIIEDLIAAARAGKDVTVVVELRARFDEEANIHLATRMQEAGVQVVFGVVGYKAHAKMLLIVRRERGSLRRYVHLSTGNYHQRTSKLYTDLSLITANPEIGEDVHKIFQQLSGLAPVAPLVRLLQSPFTLYRGLLERINRETAHARDGRTGRIIAKLNALTEPEVVKALYRASQAGVEIDLVVRGACTLRPGVADVSDNIRVRSIVGRFLEHSRLYWFANDGHEEIWASSADWMERNLLWRVETAFPLLDPALARRAYGEALALPLADNTQAWLLGSDGRYRQLEPGGDAPCCAQERLLAGLRE